jgi:hypothetical protein
MALALPEMPPTLFLLEKSSIFNILEVTYFQNRCQQEISIKHLGVMLLLHFGVCFATLSAQELPTPYVPYFSSAGAATVQFNFDISDSTYNDPTATHVVIYRDQALSTWSSSPMDLLYEACSIFTYSGEVIYTPSSGNLEWYLRSENDTAVVTQSPKNSAEVFPAPDYLLADLGADPVGDAENADGSFLDIVHCRASYSDNRLYFQLVNNGGGFPQSSGILTYYLYSVGIVDPNTSDSAAYAAIYANVLGLITTGLYRIDLADSSFSRIGNVSSSISGNALSLSCSIADLTSQPGWSSWPPPSGFIGLAPVTATQSGTNLQPNDVGKAAVYVPSSSLLDYNTNSSPSLSADTVFLLEPDTVVAQVAYVDADDNLPVMRDFSVESVGYPMTACMKDYSAGTLFEYRLIAPDTGWYRYQFLFSDGAAMASTTIDSLRVGPSGYIPGDADGSGIVNISDAVYLLSYIFGSGPEPEPYEAGDADCNGVVNIADAVYLISYIFGGGNAPCE